MERQIDPRNGELCCPDLAATAAAHPTAQAFDVLLADPDDGGAEVLFLPEPKIIGISWGYSATCWGYAESVEEGIALWEGDGLEWSNRVVSQADRRRWIREGA
jgi:hypothetical protein